MATTKFPISEELQATVQANAHLHEIHFTADGHHHFRAFECEGKKYTRLQNVPEMTNSGISTGKHVLAPIKKGTGIINSKEAKGLPDHPDHVIVETLTREQVLNATPVRKERSIGLSKADILATLEVSPEELAEFLAAQKKKK